MGKEIRKLVFDNIIFSLQKTGGGSRVWSELLKMRVDSIGLSETIFDDNIFSDSKVESRYVRKYCPMILSRYLNFRQKFCNETYIFHSSYYRVNFSRYAVNVVTVHDMIYEKFLSGLGVDLHVRQKKIAIYRADYIVCVSENTMHDLLFFYPDLDRNKIRVIYNGVNTADVNVKPYQNDNEYFLYVGHRGSIKGFRDVGIVLDLNPKLTCIVVGSQFSESELQEIQKSGLNERILNFGRVNNNLLDSLYKGAKFFFFPSRYEGFGLPALEAMSHGCPVIAADASCIPEIVGNAALLYEIDDVSSLTKALHSIEDRNCIDNLRINGFERVRIFSWDRMRTDYMNLYKEISALYG